MKRLDEHKLAFEQIQDKKIADCISQQRANIKDDIPIKVGAGAMQVSISSSVGTSVSQKGGKQIGSSPKDIASIQQQVQALSISPPTGLFADSFILIDDAKRSTMVGYFAKIGKQKFTVSLLYRATRDGFGQGDFHRTCDNQGPTITIIQTTTDHVIGGYTSEHWDSSSGWKRSLDGWLFTITHPHPFTRKKGVELGIKCGCGYGAWFGNVDLGILDNSNRDSGSEVHGGSSYEYGGVNLLDGKGYAWFTTKEIEVYQVI
ncbi:hypothetical protein FGO68_gene7824 [Halteria grandinella]|uniref:TLDc domain-containing protein n=1 Tax=Halteria grandinella TaxID=5974 RepID=A0A8J8NY84_HALGN|nr:hypothetical protein FGO68_gene7824 [Halteria grandinella]